MNALYISVLAFAILFSATEGGTIKPGKNQDLMRWETSETCNFISYAPSGEIEIGKIKAPVAKLQDSTLVTVAARGNEVYTGISAFHDLVDAAGENVGGKYMAKFLKIAPKLSAGLGVFGAVFGIIGSQMTPDANAAVAAANKAISKLTDEVNMKLDRMKMYIDNEIAKHVRDDLEKQFKEMNSHWSVCIKEKTKEKANDCMRAAFNKLQAKEAYFLQFKDNMDHHRKPKLKDVQKIEASLMMFKDYAFLMIFQLEILIDTFKEDPHWFSIYKKSLKTHIETYEHYAQWAVDQVVSYHTDQGDTRHGYCDNSFKCGTVTDYWQWFNPLWSTHSQNRVKCDCQMDEMSPELCTIHIMVELGDRSKPTSEGWTTVPELEGKDKENKVANMKDRARLVLTLGKTHSYIPNLKSAIVKYYQVNVLDRMKVSFIMEVWRALIPKISGDEYVRLDRMARKFNFNSVDDVPSHYLLKMAEDPRSRFEEEPFYLDESRPRTPKDESRPLEQESDDYFDDEFEEVSYDDENVHRSYQTEDSQGRRAADELDYRPTY